MTVLIAFAAAALIHSAPQASPQPTKAPAVAAAPITTTQDSEDEEMDQLLKVLQTETTVATKSRMNGDYVPGIVTVLDGNELQALGARTVWDALGFVPGIEAIRDGTGLPSVIVRGTDFPFNSGNVKILVDSMPAARDNAGVNGIVLDMPIELVDRIEVIRGPGSVVYGDFAYMGLVHIITKKKGTSLYARSAQGSNFSGGLQLGGTTTSGFSYAISGSVFQGEKGDLPQTRDATDDRAFGNASLKRGGLSLTGNVVRRKVEPRLNPTGLGFAEERHWGLESRYAHMVSSAVRLEGRLGTRNNKYDTSITDLRGAVTEGGIEGQWTGTRHSWLVDLAWSTSNIDEATFTSGAATPPPGQPTAPPRPGATPLPTPPPPFTVRNERLQNASAMVQDTVTIGDKAALTLGARFDRLGAVDSRVTPRASLVYRASERNIFKVQYAEGFRAPTFFELYSRGFRNDALDFEVNGTLEVNFVRRTAGTVLRLTGYRADFRDMLYVIGVTQGRTVFGNTRKGRVWGTELEFEHEFGSKIKALANLSFYDSEDSRNVQNEVRRSDGVSSGLGNLALVVAPFPKTRLSARFRHVGKRPAAVLPAYSEFEATLTQRQILPGLDVVAGVRRATGRGIFYPIIIPTSTSAVGYRFPRVFAEIVWRR